MKHDHYDDDLVDDETFPAVGRVDTDDEDDTEQHGTDTFFDIVPDGGRMRVPLQFMDSTQRAIHADAAAHRPGWRTRERVTDADADAAKSFAS
jgi:hypothetical protein